MDNNYNSNYYKKYLKYREKYLNLKNQFGGAQCPRCGNNVKDCTCDPISLLKGIVLPDHLLNEIIIIASNENMLKLLRYLVNIFDIKNLNECIYL